MYNKGYSARFAWKAHALPLGVQGVPGRGRGGEGPAGGLRPPLPSPGYPLLHRKFEKTPLPPCVYPTCVVVLQCIVVHSSFYPYTGKRLYFATLFPPRPRKCRKSSQCSVLPPGFWILWSTFSFKKFRKMKKRVSENRAKNKKGPMGVKWNSLTEHRADGSIGKR